MKKCVCEDWSATRSSISNNGKATIYYDADVLNTARSVIKPSGLVTTCIWCGQPLTEDVIEVPETIDIVFDGPPSHVSGRFVEVEDANGRSINIGNWIERPDGLWALRINVAQRVPRIKVGD